MSDPSEAAVAAETDNDRPDRTDEPAPAKPVKAWQPVGALSARAAYGLALLSGLLYFVAFPGVDVWPVSFVALVPLIVALRGQPARRAAGLGWLAGFTMTMTGFYWLLEMLKVFSGFPTIVCVFFMAILCAYQGGRIALCGWLYGRAEARGWPASLAFGLAFAVSELVFPLLFPWYYAATVHNAPVLMQTADLGGPLLVGLVLVAPNLALAELVLAWRARRGFDRRLVAVGLATPLLALGYGAVRMRQMDARMAEAETVKLGLIQPNLALFDRRKAIQLHVSQTQALRDQGVDLVVWSEAVITRAFPEASYPRMVQERLSGELGVPTILGVMLYSGERTSRGTPRRYFNTALFADETGAIHGRYDKHYLLAFGEYLPFGEQFPVLYDWSPNSGRLSPGTTTEPFRWKDHSISALICYEDILPSFVNKVVRHADPDLLVNMTNDAWFGDTTEPWIHFALAKLRAVEHRRYLVRATNSGVSGIVDAVGRVVLQSDKTFVETTLIGEARYLRSHTVYETLGDIPWWIATAGIGWMAFVTRKRRPGAPAAR
jgi:apolipoprotein N-acyltransferase